MMKPQDQYFDLRALSDYSALAVPTLRDHLKTGRLPHFKVKGKLLVRRSEFDKWIEAFRVNPDDVGRVVDQVMESLKSDR